MDVNCVEVMFSVHLCNVGVAVAVADDERCLRVSWLLWTVLTPSSVLNTTRTRPVSARVNTTNTGETPQYNTGSVSPLSLSPPQPSGRLIMENVK